MNIHPSFVVKKQNGLYVGKTSNDVAEPQEAKLYPNEYLAKNACYCTEQIESILAAGDRIVIHRLYPNRWFQFDGELAGWSMKESEATIFASKEVASEICSKHNIEFKHSPERFCLEMTDRLGVQTNSDTSISIFDPDELNKHPVGTSENPIVNTYEYRGTQQSVLDEIPNGSVLTGSLWTTPASQIGASSSLSNTSIDYSVTREDMLAAISRARKEHEHFFGLNPINPDSERLVNDLIKRNQKPYERTRIPSSKVMKVLENYMDAIKRFDSWSSVVSSRKFAPDEHPYIQFAQSIVDRDQVHKELVDILRNENG